MRTSLGTWVIGVAAGVAGCTGAVGDLPERPASWSDSADTATGTGPSGLRRLTAAEYDRTVRDLLFLDAVDASLLLPEDRRNPFDNDASTQGVSQALIEGAELLASDLRDAVLGDPSRRDRVVGCTPTGADDEDCMRAFIARFGRLALRRTLTDAEVDGFLLGADAGAADGALDVAIATNDFHAGVGFALAAFLQDPEFLYRIERGEPVAGSPGLRRLGDVEVAVRLSYLLWGSTPDDALLRRAEQGGLSSSDAIAEEARRMLADPRAVERKARFVALWLGYEQTIRSGTAVTDAMLAESRSLVERVLFTERRPWQDLFTFEETFVNDALAEHYGWAPPGSTAGAWVPYDRPQRRGILSHGAFLALGRAFGDTSPVQRGLAIRRRLLCQDIPPPPPTVDVDQPPGEGASSVCKEDRYAMHRAGDCARCHALLDPIGLGLEHFDLGGRYREREPDNPTTPADESACAIRGQGEIHGIGAFSGPADLASLALESGLLNPCLIAQYYRFAAGRFELVNSDLAVLQEVSAQLGARFDAESLVLAIVTHPSFRLRREAARGS